MSAPEQFNEWADKIALTKDMIIHSHVIPPSVGSYGRFVISVFFDEKMHPQLSEVNKHLEKVT